MNKENQTSDTPETDASIENIVYTQEHVNADFARKLERERDAERKEKEVVYGQLLQSREFVKQVEAELKRSINASSRLWIADAATVRGLSEAREHAKRAEAERDDMAEKYGKEVVAPLLSLIEHMATALEKGTRGALMPNDIFAIFTAALTAAAPYRKEKE